MDTHEERELPDFHPDCDAIAVNADKVWFTVNPGRRFRARQRFPGELAGPNEDYVVVERVPLGRHRLSFCWRGGSAEPPDDDIQLEKLMRLLLEGEVALCRDGQIMSLRDAPAATE